MSFLSYISVRWGQLLGYSAGGALALQSAKSTYLGTKKIISAVHGSETYQERIQKAATDNLTILSNLKNFVVGSDSFSDRFSHLTKGFENLAIAFISGLFSYLLIFKAFEPPSNKNLTPLPDTSALNQRHNENLMNGQKASNAFKGDNCLITNFFNPTSRSKLAQCNEKGYLSEDYFLEDDLSQLDLSTMYDILRCLEEFSLFKRMREIIKLPPVETKLLQKAQDRAQSAIHEVMDNTTRTDLTNFKTTELIISPDEQSQQDLKVVLDGYLDNFFTLYDEVLNGYKEYLEGHKSKLNRFIMTNMTKTAGPFDIHLEKVCNEKLFDRLPFINNLDNQYCSEYNKLKRALRLAHEQKLAIDKLDPHFSRTDCYQDVFKKLFERANQAELMLPPNLYQAFVRLQKEISERFPEE